MPLPKNKLLEIHSCTTTLLQLKVILFAYYLFPLVFRVLNDVFFLLLCKIRSFHELHEFHKPARTFPVITASSTSIESPKITGSTCSSRNASTDSKFAWERNPILRSGPFLIASLSWSKLTMFSLAFKGEQSARKIAISGSKSMFLIQSDFWKKKYFFK